MDLRDKNVVVTGGAGGIGSALCRAFADEGARVVVADVTYDRAAAVAEEIDGRAIDVDCGAEESIAEAIEAIGPIDVWFSNAGVPGSMGGPESPDGDWDESWRVNVMQHVWAARRLIPQMTDRGEGYLINTASAAGLLTQVSALPYSVTKHAAVALAEWLAITYRDAGVRVSCLCPQAVQTAMLDLAMEEPAGAAALRSGGIMEPADVADVVVEAIGDERFLILPHPDVAKFMAFKASQPDRWLDAMRGLVRAERGA
jgi:NAD(P)-dependent dehydrogenase (short-subunit alcohol dehydrogenase family)